MNVFVFSGFTGGQRYFGFFAEISSGIEFTNNTGMTTNKNISLDVE